MSKNSTYFTHFGYSKKSDSFNKKDIKNHSLNEAYPRKRTVDTILGYARSARRVKTNSLDSIVIVLN